MTYRTQPADPQHIVLQSMGSTFWMRLRLNLRHRRPWLMGLATAALLLRAIFPMQFQAMVSVSEES